MSSRNDWLKFKFCLLFLSHLIDLIKLTSKIFDNFKDRSLLSFILKFILVVELLVLSESFFNSLSKRVIISVSFLFEVLIQYLVKLLLMIKKKYVWWVFVKCLKIVDKLISLKSDCLLFFLILGVFKSNGLQDDNVFCIIWINWVNRLGSPRRLF